MNATMADQVDKDQIRSCAYVLADGSHCPGEVGANDALCFWHDPEASKEGPDIRERLEEWAHSGKSMEGFVLRYAHLEGAKLNSHQGFDLSKTNLFRANLQGAHMYNVNLQRAG